MKLNTVEKNRKAVFYYTKTLGGNLIVKIKVIRHNFIKPSDML